MSDSDSEIELRNKFKTSVDYMHEYLENINSAELLTPNEVFYAIQKNEATIEIIGYVDKIELPRTVDNSQQECRILKFYLNNGDGRRVQVVAWDDNIDNIYYCIKLNHIIHLDGVQAQIPKGANNGNVPYELLIRNNCTIINNFGIFRPIQNFQEIHVPIQNNESSMHQFIANQRIILEAYIKTNFFEIHDIERNEDIGLGSITDGIYKVEIHILNFSNDEYWKYGIYKGDKIKINGIVAQTTVNPVYILVNDIKDIQKLKGRMPLSTLLKGVRIPKKI